MAIGRKSKKIEQRRWRPDFRDVETLPDTKVIRTGFLLNFVAVALTLLVLSVFIVREYSLQNMKREVADLELQVADGSAKNRVLLDANKRFKQSSTIVEEVIDFDEQVLDLPDFIESLATLIPEGMILSLVEMRFSDNPVTAGKSKVPPFLVNFKGRVTGTESASPSQIITDLQKSIIEVSEIQSMDVATDLTSFNRNNEFGYFDFTLQVIITAKADSKS